ncbi:MAG: protein phosphatase 2C domain-containing protein [Polyangiaceae bacterium]
MNWTWGALAAVVVVGIGAFIAWTLRGAEPAPPTRPSATDPEPLPEADAAAAPEADARAEPSQRTAPVRLLPTLHEPEDEDDDITRVTFAPRKEVLEAAKNGGDSAIPKITDYEDMEDEPPSHDEVAVPIVYDDDAANDEPTRPKPVIVVSGAAQSDVGRKRRKNEDAFLLLDARSVYVVADGMGGYAGGDIASKMAVEVVEKAFKESVFPGRPYEKVPRRGSDVVVAITEANRAIYEHARANPHLEGMGTTIVVARFSPNKQRLYIGHVGDSRAYRLRDGELRQMTSDHTLGALGFGGTLGTRLSRAVGTKIGVVVDLIIARPIPEDVYLLCSDGLTKMIGDDEIKATMSQHDGVPKILDALIEKANAAGGKDNVTVVLLKVERPK